MGRKKGSLNKKSLPIQLEFQEKTEVKMTIANEEELETVQKELDLARVELEKTKLEIESKKQQLKEFPVQAKAIESPAVAIKDNTLAQKIAEEKAKDNVMVTGKFYNLRAKGQQAKITYNKYVDDPVKWYVFQHGEIYTIPKGFADQINNHYYTPHFVKNEGQIIDPSNPESGIHAVDTSDKMYSFTPINF